MTKHSDLKKLHEIANMILQTELAKLAAIAEEERGPKQALETMSEEQTRIFAQSGGGSELLTRGATENWIIWARNERQKITTTLLEIQTRKERQIARSQQAFGKRTALEKIMRKTDVRR